MPVKLRNRLTGIIIDVNVRKVNTVYPNNLWEPILQKDIIEVFELKGIYKNEKYLKGKYEKEEGLKLLTENSSYQFEAVPDFNLLLLPNQIPEIPQITPQPTNSHAGTKLWKKSKNIFKNISQNDYIKFTIIGLIVAFLTWYFGFNKIR